MVATRRHPDGDFPDRTTTPPSASPSKTTSAPTNSHTKPTHYPHSTSKSRAHSTTSSGYTHLAPYPLVLWLLVSLPLVIWDTAYIFLRPHSMPGGYLHSPIWTPYALYGTIDYVYGWPAWNDRSGFTGAQGSLNAVETLLYGYYLWVVWTRAREPRGGKGLGWLVGASEEGRRRKVVGGAGLAVVVAFAGAVMTVSKTVLYWLHEYCSGFANIGHNDPITLFIYWIIPNGPWLVLPSYMIYELGKEIVNALDGTSAKAKR